MRADYYSSEPAPDRAFMKELKRLDKRLGCKYRRDIKRFVITWERSWGPVGECLVVKDETGGFRQPDRRDLLILCEGDLHRTDLRDRIVRADAYMQEWREKEEKREHDEIRNQTKDDKLQLAKAYRQAFNRGVKGDPFRKVIPKKRDAVTINQTSV